MKQRLLGNLRLPLSTRTAKSVNLPFFLVVLEKLFAAWHGKLEICFHQRKVFTNFLASLAWKISSWRIATDTRTTEKNLTKSSPNKRIGDRWGTWKKEIKQRKQETGWFPLRGEVVWWFCDLWVRERWKVLENRVPN